MSADTSGHTFCQELALLSPVIIGAEAVGIKFAHFLYRPGLGSRPVRLGLEELSDLLTSWVLHWELKHSVVLERDAREGAYIFDPAYGRRKIDW